MDILPKWKGMYGVRNQRVSLSLFLSERGIVERDRKKDGEEDRD